MRWVIATLSLVLVASCGAAPQEPGSLTASELATRLQSGDAPVVLDVRTRKEFAAGHIPGAVNIPHDELEARVGEIEAHRDHELVAHCQSGRRAGIALGVLREAGFQQVIDLEGHWRGWQAGGYPTE